ncbi:MAG: macrolide ABC transporter ATP-binding protein [Candidatus Melainabacteria bacterium RIFOXYA12_FULL_32_12]|nr:MAG: macrolide ABC transporter ATP-binding protein [Candidatus Melainabacteria bacterium RIFOXYA2_FULL_32_9]OGI30489.1 MAG: macrolide ABC transporter ATP-binding protein [Candidatus Melainabacteria bacterium RIFOXYA12_FULL_32_12]
MTLIEIKDVNKVYTVGDIKVNALNNMSLIINSGEFISIMGPSGSGKSTFMNILGCLDIPTTGKYFLDGIDVTRLNKDQLANIRNLKIGFIFQGFNLISRTTAIENVELPMIYKGVSPKERRKRTLEVLKSVGLEGREHHTPNQLSGGQQQRVAIARAIVNDAPIIMADEPTGNLDTKTSCEIMELFTRLNKESNKTIILVTHETEIAEYSQRIIRFKDGNLVRDEVISTKIG